MRTLAEKIARHMIKTDACWIWTGPHNGAGYGRIWHQGRKIYVHRAIYESAYGPIPPSVEVCHSCDNPFCVRPDHLFMGTHQENMSDMVAKGRHPSHQKPETRPRGEQHARAKLTNVGVRAIRVRHAGGESVSSLARAFGLDRVAIRNVITRKTWQHVD